MNNLEKEEILSKEILHTIDVILKESPEVVFGGSIALNAVGLINRPISDIDLFFPLKTRFIDIGILHTNETNDTQSETTTDINGKLIERVGAKIGKIKICCFKVPDEILQYSKITVLGRTLNIQNVNQAIIAKMVYAKGTSNNKKYYAKNHKHENDLTEIFSALKGLF